MPGDVEVNEQLKSANSNVNLAQHSPKPVGSNRKPRQKFWLLLLSFLGLLAGLAGGGGYSSQCQNVYQSKATALGDWRGKRVFRLGEDSGTKWDSNLRHEQRIREDDILTKCLVKYGLNDLPSLRDLSLAEQVKEIQDHLVVFQNRDEPSFFELEYSAPNPKDTQTVLATIVSVYDKHLEEKCREPDGDTMELLKKMSAKFHDEVKSIDKQLNTARFESLVLTGPIPHMSSTIAELMKKIEVKKNRLVELTSDLSKGEAALKDGREACMEYVWGLEEGGKIKRDSLPKNSPELLVDLERIEELELQRDQLLVVHIMTEFPREDIKALNLAIADRKKKYGELWAKEAKVREASAQTPKQVVQRYLDSVKRQIGVLRSALNADLAAYSESYEKLVRKEGVVESERVSKEVSELLERKEKFAAKAEMVDRQIIEEGRPRGRMGLVFETTRPACEGRQVWPSLAVILPVAGLVGASLGLGLGCLVMLVFRGS